MQSEAPRASARLCAAHQADWDNVLEEDEASRERDDGVEYWTARDLDTRLVEVGRCVRAAKVDAIGDGASETHGDEDDKIGQDVIIGFLRPINGHPYRRRTIRTFSMRDRFEGVSPWFIMLHERQRIVVEQS